MYKDSNKSVLKLIFKEIYLLVVILIVAISIAFFISKNQTPKIKETYSKAILFLPPIELFSTYHNILFDKNFTSGKDMNSALSQKRYNINFISTLVSLKNLNNFLDLETSINYSKFFKQIDLDVKNYFNQNNFEIVSSPLDKDKQFIFILSIKHPLGLEKSDFIQNYIKFTKNNLLNEQIELSKASINSISLYLQHNLQLNKKINIQLNKKININDENSKNSRRFKVLKLLVDEFYNENEGVSDTLNYLVRLEDEEINKKILFLNGVKEKINQIDYNPIQEIRTIPYIEINFIYRNIILSIIISFVSFFSILIFKELYKDYLKK